MTASCGPTPSAILRRLQEVKNALRSSLNLGRRVTGNPKILAVQVATDVLAIAVHGD